jgi:outer membrane protein assembly factor BamA
MTKIKSLLIFTLLFLKSLQAQEMVREDSVPSQNRLYPIPIFFWSPETKFAGGFAVSYLMQAAHDSIARPTSLGATFIYSQKKQIVTALSYDHYWDRNIYHFVGSLGYSKFPTIFYGIGNQMPDSNGENFTPKSLSLIMNLHKKIRHGLYLGGQYELDYTQLAKIKTGGKLETNSITGKKSGTSSGLGATASWDTRDNTLYPTAGSYDQLSIIPFAGIFGSHYRFIRTTLDVRQYFSLWKTHVFAYQLYANIITGDPPFYKMSLLGGSNLMRGYYEGRYRDRDMLAFQVEYRLPVWWRFGVVGFAGYGDVAHRLSDFRIKDFKYSVGYGIRFGIDPQNRLNIRLDIGYGKNSAYPTIAFQEAF